MSVEHRSLRFESIQQAMAEAERLASIDVRTTGQFSLGQILEHLARTLDIVTGRLSGPPVSGPMRMAARLLRPFVLRKASTGFKLPAKAQGILWPSEPVSTDQGLAHLRDSYEHFRAPAELPDHPIFGRMTRAQHDALQCRHFEGHLGFVHEAETPPAS
ncbi:DUF1569 domain-containing protein [Roseiconus nitratireducens]|uniref:DUF1569 domain-containing protein n=1 Tax=Roseiconus nitratireducens TaxID=2605748 RepID=A0A5M6DI76_9BACT|nr:DUF1569 domain-containing protein [Roseiconus nitratireducens]KAA5547173.1 DUF1569 domain-containing protein [Roseiconus nitratireducens]